MMKRFQVVAAMCAGILFSGCGDEKAPEKASTSTPSTVKADDQGSQPAKADAGGSDVKAEPIAAADFPMPPDAGKPIYTAETSTIMFHQTGKVAPQAKFYTEQLEKLGWKKDPSSEVTPEGPAFLDFKKGSLAITVTINPRDEKITTMAQGSGLSVPEDAADSD